MIEGEFVAEIDFGSESINAIVSWEATAGNPSTTNMRVDICLVEIDCKGNVSDKQEWVDVGDLLSKEKLDELGGRGHDDGAQWEPEGEPDYDAPTQGERAEQMEGIKRTVGG